jgi:hypothetical protein
MSDDGMSNVFPLMSILLVNTSTSLISRRPAGGETRTECVVAFAFPFDLFGRTLISEFAYAGYSRPTKKLFHRFINFNNVAIRSMISLTAKWFWKDWNFPRFRAAFTV